MTDLPGIRPNLGWSTRPLQNMPASQNSKYLEFCGLRTQYQLERHDSVRWFRASSYLHALDWHDKKCVVTFVHAGAFRNRPNPGDKTLLVSGVCMGGVGWWYVGWGVRVCVCVWERERVYLCTVYAKILRHCCTHFPCWLRAWGGASSFTKMRISQSALCAFASACTLVSLALSVKCWRIVAGTVCGWHRLLKLHVLSFSGGLMNTLYRLTPPTVATTLNAVYAILRWARYQHTFYQIFIKTYVYL